MLRPWETLLTPDASLASKKIVTNRASVVTGSPQSACIFRTSQMQNSCHIDASAI